MKSPVAMASPVTMKAAMPSGPEHPHLDSLALATPLPQVGQLLGQMWWVTGGIHSGFMVGSWLQVEYDEWIDEWIDGMDDD